ncbi:MAG TPA: DUF1512 domain-containing protein [Conexivisphaerales archaeon]|nr:DUF1512 domain-containing protein [Conexivisphaerales archaeon]
MLVPLQLAGNDIGTYAYYAIFIVMFALSWIYGYRASTLLSMRKIGKDLARLEGMKEGAKARLREELGKYGGDPASIKSQVDQLVSSVMIEPVSIDPKGFVYKLDRVLKTYEDYFKSRVAFVTPNADKTTRQNLSNLVEVGMALDYLYRYVRHLYTSAKKDHDMMSSVLLQASMPQLMETADAYYSSIGAFSKGEVIGDGLGPLVASKIIASNPVKEVDEETVFSEMTFDGRKLLVVRAEGPGGTVGRPGEAVDKLLHIYPDTSMVVTVDAALKLEGERSGEIAEGIGAAIGGPGVDRYMIEETATKNKVPLYAVVVKMSEKEAITGMKDDVKNAADSVIARIRKLIEDKTKPDATVLLAGIGNTMGVR